MKSLTKFFLLLLLCWPLTGFQGNRAELYLKSAVKMQAKGLDQLALQYFGKAIEADPTQTRAYQGRAFLYMGAGNVEGALSDLSRVIEIDPKDPANYLTRGLALSQSGARDAAARDFRKGCELGDQSACDLVHELVQ